jgi:hypothetical protein
MYCRWCGEFLPGSRPLFHDCGSKERPAAFCRGCGTRLKEDSSFCFSCATPVGELPRPAVNAMQPTTSSDESDHEGLRPPAPVGSFNVSTLAPASAPSGAPHQRFVPQHGTSYFAIASLVISMFWLYSLFSPFGVFLSWDEIVLALIAVTFGVVALVNIKRAAWPLAGRSLAVAGILIGTWGFIGAVHNQIKLNDEINAIKQLIPPPPVTVPMGTTKTLTHSYGLRSITVESMTYPVQYTAAYPPQGWKWAAFKVRVCAGKSGSKLSSGDFLFETYNKQFRLEPTDIDGNIANTPLTFFRLHADQCVSGYIASGFTSLMPFFGGRFGVAPTDPTDRTLFAAFTFWRIPQR